MSEAAPVDASARFYRVLINLMFQNGRLWVVKGYTCKRMHLGKTFCSRDYKYDMFYSTSFKGYTLTKVFLPFHSRIQLQNSFPKPQENWPPAWIKKKNIIKYKINCFPGSILNKP